MAEQNLGPRDFFAKEDAIADLGLIACPGAEELCKLVDGHLVRWAQEVGMNVDTFIIPSDCPRFQSGDAKGLVKTSTRGDDLFLFVDRLPAFPVRRRQGPRQDLDPRRRPVPVRRSGQLQRYLPALRV